MSAAWLCAACFALASAPGRAQTAADEVRSALAAEDYAVALDATRGVADPLERARLERTVRHHAGDLDGALTVGEAGLELAPDDLELLLGTADVALSLGLAQRTAALAQRLERGVAGLAEDAPNRAWWQARGAQIGASAGSLEELARARTRALQRGYVVSLAGIALAAGALAALARRRRWAKRCRPSEAWTR